MPLFLKLVVFIFLFNNFAVAAERELYLRRVSFLLTGVSPDNTDLSKLKSLSEKEFEDFLSLKIDDYLNTDFFPEKMRQHVLDSLAMKTTPPSGSDLYLASMFEQNDSSSFLPIQKHHSVLDQFLINLFKKNSSWDFLLTGNTYQINADKNDGLADLDFYQDIFDVSKVYRQFSGTVLIAKTDKEAQSLAGVLTTPRFFARYTSSEKKARAIFKFFLCVANESAPTANSLDQELLLEKTKKILIEKSLNISTNYSSSENSKYAECANCTFDIESLGQAFRYSSRRPYMQKSPGRLKYISAADLKRIDSPFDSIGSMAKLIVQQKDYVGCQVEHFWDWFVGEDIPLSQKKKESLISFFNLHSRQPKSLIKHILLKEYSLYKRRLAIYKNNQIFFGNYFYRSLQNFEFYQILKHQFKLTPEFIFSCRPQRSDLLSLGLQDPGSEARYPHFPNLSYYQLLYNCSHKIAFLSEPAIKINFSQADWVNSDDSMKRVILKNIIHAVLGTNIYPDDVVEKMSNDMFPFIKKILISQNRFFDLTYMINLTTSYVVLTKEYLTI